MHFKLTHVISIYETIKNSYDGEKDYFKEKKTKTAKTLLLEELLYPPLKRATV